MLFLTGSPMARAVPNVFTVAPGQNFASLVVGNLLAGRLIDLPFRADPALLADLVLYVPTQRVRRILEAEFATALAPRPAILPRIRPLGEPGDPLDRWLDAHDAFGSDETLAAREGGALPSRPVISAIQRCFLLLPLIEKWRAALRREVAGAPEDRHPGAVVSIRESLALADALGRLIDEMRISGVPLENLESSVPPGYDPSRFDAYWEKTRDFLKIAARYWPQRLEEVGGRDEMDLRLEAIEAEAHRLEREAPATPILVLGSTGSVSATARLMRAVSRLDHGAVVLPGLDLHLDEVAWAEIGAENASLATRFAHPQAALKRVLAEIGLPRGAVTPLAPETAETSARNRAISESLRPAESVDAWRGIAATIDIDAALDGMTFVEAADERDEALSVAVLMRETLETPEATVAFVTADRGLARRVRSEMRRWDVEVEDSAGSSLVERPLGTLLRLFLRAASERDGGSVLALLRHPLARAGYSEQAIEALVDAFEIIVFRGRNFSPSQTLQERVRHALANPPSHPHEAHGRISDAVRTALPELAAMIEDAFSPFSSASPARPLSDFAVCLTDALSGFCRDETGASALEADPDYAALITMLRDIAIHGTACVIEPSALGGVIDVFLARGILAGSRTGHPRGAILGPLEARLVFADRTIIGGLNEGSFPPIAEEDPFLNRAMRLNLGLQPPERRIGQSAHDFTMLAGHKEVIFTRAARVGGQPAIPSRFLRRLEAFAGAERWKTVVARGASVLRLGHGLDKPDRYAPILPPAPIPAAPRVPEKLSITEIETLRRDPYAIYARHILRLVPLEPIDPELDARERGTILHACLEEYARSEPPHDPERAAQVLIEIGAERFKPIQHELELSHFWRQRFSTIIADFVAFDRARRDAGYRILTEVRGTLPLELKSGQRVTIYGKADRIELDASGSFAVFDYKSGAPPGNPTIGRGLAPQLPITAALALRGAFRAMPAPPGIIELAHIGIGGGKPFDIRPVVVEGLTLVELAEQNWQRLERELLAFALGERGYQARIAPAHQDREGDYDHLARVREWQTSGGAAEPFDEASEGAAGETSE